MALLDTNCVNDDKIECFKKWSQSDESQQELRYQLTHQGLDLKSSNDGGSDDDNESLFTSINSESEWYNSDQRKKEQDKEEEEDKFIKRVKAVRINKKMWMDVHKNVSDDVDFFNKNI